MSKETVPQIVMAGDKNRTRETDPLTSHLAGDRSQETVSAVQAAVIVLLLRNGPQPGSRLNEMYHFVQHIYGWPLVHFDSPRKRAGELVADGRLVVTNADAKRGTERVFALPAESEQVAA